jgi:Bacterial PH domain
VSSQQDQASAGDTRPDGALPAPAAMLGPVASGPIPPGPVAPGPVPPSPAPQGPVPPSPVQHGPVPPGQASPGGTPAGSGPVPPGLPGSRLKSAWRTTEDGRTVFRLIPPLVLWWGWVAFAVVNLADLVIQSRDWFSLEIAAGLLVGTGIMYACTVHPKIISDAEGLTIRNPFRDYRVPWGGVAGVFLGDSVEIHCERPAPRPPKAIYSWALYSPRRARARADLRVGFGTRRERERHDMRARRRFEVPDATAFGRMPDKAKEIASQHPSHVMATELTRRCEEARQRGTPPGVVAASWAWPPIAAVLIPAAALIAVILAR